MIGGQLLLRIGILLVAGLAVPGAAQAGDQVPDPPPVCADLDRGQVGVGQPCGSCIDPCNANPKERLEHAWDAIREHLPDIPPPPHLPTLLETRNVLPFLE